MGLFSTLIANKTENDPETTKSSLDLPTVIQLYTQSNPPLLQPRNVSYAALDYTPLITTAVEGKPDLGIWHCRCDFSDVLLPKAYNTFVVTVDLCRPITVEPSLSKMQAALVRHLIQNPPPETTPSSGDEKADAVVPATTSLYDLKLVQFGRADKDRKQESEVAPDEEDRNVKATLMIMVKTPPVKKDEKTEENGSEDYKRQQEVALLTYHLRKFAASIQCSLVFVRDEATLPTLLKSFVLGEKIVSEDDAKPEQVVENEVFGPTSSEELELIETVLLRNATYPGHWDASTDSIWKILPEAKEKETVTKNLVSGDQNWLEELRQSVGPVEPAGLQTPPPRANADANKTPNDAAVSSYFESLLS